MALSVVVAACGDDDEDGGADDTAAETADTSRQPPTPTPAPTRRPPTRHGRHGQRPAGESMLNGEIPCEQQYAGKTVEILSPARNSENDQDRRVATTSTPTSR